MSRQLRELIDIFLIGLVFIIFFLIVPWVFFVAVKYMGYVYRVVGP